MPAIRFPKVEWRAADVATSPLGRSFRGADAVVHLAWLIQPGRDRNLTRRVNVLGSERVFRAVADASVRTLVYASSVGAYGHGPKDRRVDESWPTTGTESSFYARDKATVERLLDRFEREQPGVRAVRLRPGLIFSREAASEIRRLFAGPLLPGSLVRPRLIPIVPKVERLVFQAVHSRDVARAYRLAITGRRRRRLQHRGRPGHRQRPAGRALLRPPVAPLAVARAGRRGAAFRLRLQPSEPGWLDMALAVPLMDTSRARERARLGGAQERARRAA